VLDQELLYVDEVAESKLRFAAGKEPCNGPKDLVACLKPRMLWLEPHVLPTGSDAMLLLARP
jgi:hypothetical protein